MLRKHLEDKNQSKRIQSNKSGLRSWVRLSDC